MRAYLGFNKTDILKGRQITELLNSTALLQMKPGCFVDNPAFENPNLSPELVANKINSFLKKWGAVVATHGNSHALSHKSALTLTSDENGLTLYGVKNQNYSLTEKLKSQLPEAISSKIVDLPITVISDNNVTKAAIVEWKTPSAKSVIAYKDQVTPSVRFLTPEVALTQMDKAKSIYGNKSSEVTMLSLAHYMEKMLDAQGKAVRNIGFKRVDKQTQEVAGNISRYSNLINKLPEEKRKGIEQKLMIQLLQGPLTAAEGEQFILRWHGDPIGRLSYVNWDVEEEYSYGQWLLLKTSEAYPFNFQELSFGLSEWIRSYLPEREMDKKSLHGERHLNESQVLDIIKAKPYWLNNLSCIQAKSPINTKLVEHTSSTKPVNNGNPYYLEGFFDDQSKYRKEDYENLADKLQSNQQTASLAGMQPKASVYFENDNGHNVIKSAEQGKATHILKFPGVGRKQGMTAAEMLGMLAAKEIGLNVPNIHMITVSKPVLDLLVPPSTSKKDRQAYIRNGEPGFIIERFDLSEEGKNEKKTLVEAIALLGESNKTQMAYDFHPLTKISDMVKKHSTNWEEDRVLLFKTALLNTIIGNNDTHLKNWGMLYTQTDNKTECRLSPAYDLCAIGALKDFCGMIGPCQLGGRPLPTFNDILTFAEHGCDIPKQEAKSIVEEVWQCLTNFTSRLNDPKSDYFDLFARDPISKEVKDKAVRHMELAIELQKGQHPELDIEDFYDHVHKYKNLPNGGAEFKERLLQDMDLEPLSKDLFEGISFDIDLPSMKR